MKKRILMGIIGLLILPNIVFAANYGMAFNCTETATPGDKVTCNIRATIDSTINGIQGKITAEGISDYTFIKNSDITCFSCDNSGFVYGETDGIFNKVKTNNVLLGSIEFTVPQGATSGTTYKFKLSNLAISVLDDGPGEQLANLTASVVVRTKSNNNSLSSLNVGNYPLEPAFNADTTRYTVKADDNAKINISATAADGHSTVNGTGEKTLKYGDNSFKIEVMSEVGEVKTYEVIINRFDSRDKVNTLNNLVIVGYDLDQAFDPNKTSYTATIPSNISKVKIEAERTNALNFDKPKSTFEKNAGPREVTVKYGKHPFEIRVKAENGAVKKYVINITRIDDRDPNNYLKNLGISSGKYKFNKETSNYIINVENNVGVVNITCEAESEKAKVTCPGKVDLKVGSNKVTAIVQAENETERKYNITINRLKEGTTIEEVENIIYLKQLSVLNKNIKFNQKTTSYEIPITKDNTLTFEYELFDGVNGTIELKDDNTGPIKLSTTKDKIDISPVIDGSIIYLNVESEEGYSRLYTFTVKTADYYIGDIDIPVEKEKIEVKWTWQLIVGLASFVILLAEIGFAIYIAIKNGGVENKKAEASAAIKGGIADIKKLPQKAEEKKAMKEAIAKQKEIEKAQKAELKKKEAEERKRQKEEEKIRIAEQKKAIKEQKELDKQLMEQKKKIAKEAAEAEKAYIDSFKNQGK